MDGAGNIALAYNVSNGSSVFPGLRYIGRRATDPLGTMPRGEFVLMNGNAPEGTDRWGDYAAMTVDPVDDSTLWYTGMYTPPGGFWATRIAALTLTPPAGPVSQNVTLAQGASATAINFGNHFVGNGMWDGGGDGINWTDPLNWSNDALPSSGDDVLIDVPGVQNIQLTSGAQSIRSLTCQENLAIVGGSVTIAQPSTVNGSLTLSGSGALYAGNSLKAAAVSVTAGAQFNLTASGMHVLDANTLSVDTASRLDQADNDLIIRAGELGSWDGTHYTAITGLIQSGRNTGAWNGKGIVTSSANGSFTTLGVARASDRFGGLSGLFAGQTVSGGDVLVKFTYGGDANLDGKINIDDYGHIDTSIGIGLKGWYNGDFNYDGIINIDDYGIIDVNVGIQGPAFPTGAAAGGLTAVPEPASLAILPMAVAVLLGRRRRGNVPVRV
jgi:hypothetical protein